MSSAWMVIVRVSPAALKRSASAFETMMPEMSAVPETANGTPATLLPMTMPVAPAASALSTFAWKVHVPRSTKT